MIFIRYLRVLYNNVIYVGSLNLLPLWLDSFYECIYVKLLRIIACVCFIIHITGFYKMMLFGDVIMYVGFIHIAQTLVICIIKIICLWKMLWFKLDISNNILLLCILLVKLFVFIVVELFGIFSFIGIDLLSDIISGIKDIASCMLKRGSMCVLNFIKIINGTNCFKRKKE